MCRVCHEAEPLIGRAHPEQGFTLIEALVALTILAIGLAVFSPSFGSAARNFTRLEDRLTAQQVASSLLDQRMATRQFVPGTTSGRQGSYRWQIVVKLAAEDLTSEVIKPWALYEVDIVVDWATQRRLQLQTLQLARAP